MVTISPVLEVIKPMNYDLSKRMMFTGDEAETVGANRLSREKTSDGVAMAVASEMQAPLEVTLPTQETADSPAARTDGRPAENAPLQEASSIDAAEMLPAGWRNRIVPAAIFGLISPLEETSCLPDTRPSPIAETSAAPDMPGNDCSIQPHTKTFP